MVPVVAADAPLKLGNLPHKEKKVYIGRLEREDQAMTTRQNTVFLSLEGTIHRALEDREREPRKRADLREMYI